MGKFDKKNVAANGGGRVAPRSSAKELNSNPEFQKIASWLASVKFQKKAVGGLDPVDVWNKIEELNKLYENALTAERIRSNMLIRQIRMNSLSADEPSEDSDGF